MAEDALEQLEESKQSVGGSGDYAPWWNRENFDVEEGDKVVGVVVEKHAYTDPGGDEHPVATIRSIGTGSLSEGTEVSTPTRKAIEPFAEKVGIGDFALIEYDGEVQANSGRDMHTYSASRLTQEEWKETDQADLIQEVWEASSHHSGGGSSDSSGGNSSTESGVPSDAVDFAQDVLAMNDDEVSVDELDEYLNDIRDYDVDVDDVIEAADLTEDDGTVTA